MSKDWSWYGDSEKESVVVPAVQAIAVYSNTAGEIVIRQQSQMGEDDSVVVFPKSQAKAIIDAIMTEIEVVD